MKKLLFAIPFMLVLLALAITPALAAPPAAPLAWPKEGGATCSLVYAKIKNDGNFRFYSSYIRANGSDVVGPDWGPVAPDQWVQVSWTPPANFVGSVEASVVLWHTEWSWSRGWYTVVDDSKVVTGNLNCQPDYQLNLSHIECSEEGSNGNYVEVHFVLLNVPDGTTPGDFVTFTDGVNSWQAPRGAHTGNVWHYTAYLPDGYYDITGASVGVNSYTVTLHNPHEDKGTYNCAPDQPATVSVELGVCSWTEQTGSVTPLDLSITGVATVYVDGEVAHNADLLAPGDHPWYAVAGDGYYLVGLSEGVLHVGDCTPEGSASYKLGVCSWSEEEGSITPATITVNHAVVSGLPGGDITETKTLDLAPDDYSGTWVATDGYNGSGSFEFTVGDCTPPPASVIVSGGVCTYREGTSFTFTFGEGIEKVVITGADDFELEITHSGAAVTLPPGDYSYEGVLKEGYRPEGELEGTLEVRECPPKPVCPTCGPPVWESSYGDRGPGLAVAWFSPDVCKVCLRTWSIKLDTWVKMWSDVSSYSVKYRGQCYASETRTAYNGSIWHYLLLDLNDHDGAIELYADSDCTKRVREAMPVYKWNACSVAPGWYSTTAEGFVVELGQNRSDIVSWMLREPVFFSGVPYRGDTIIKWVDDNLPAGPLVPGTVMPLPSS